MPKQQTTPGTVGPERAQHPPLRHANPCRQSQFPVQGPSDGWLQRDAWLHAFMVQSRSPQQAFSPAPAPEHAFRTVRQRHLPPLQDLPQHSLSFLHFCPVLLHLAAASCRPRRLSPAARPPATRACSRPRRVPLPASIRLARSNLDPSMTMLLWGFLSRGPFAAHRHVADNAVAVDPVTVAAAVWTGCRTRWRRPTRCSS
jgi:hypothetical protein